MRVESILLVSALKRALMTLFAFLATAWLANFDAVTRVGLLNVGDSGRSSAGNFRHWRRYKQRLLYSLDLDAVAVLTFIVLLNVYLICILNIIIIIISTINA